MAGLNHQRIKNVIHMVIFLGETELYDNDNGNASKVLAHLGVLTI